VSPAGVVTLLYEMPLLLLALPQTLCRSAGGLLGGLLPGLGKQTAGR